VTCLHTNSPGHIWTTLYNNAYGESKWPLRILCSLSWCFIAEDKHCLKNRKLSPFRGHWLALTVDISFWHPIHIFIADTSRPLHSYPLPSLLLDSPLYTFTVLICSLPYNLVKFPSPKFLHPPPPPPHPRPIQSLQRVFAFILLSLYWCGCVVLIGGQWI
jgi:hypothetical protein